MPLKSVHAVVIPGVITKITRVCTYMYVHHSRDREYWIGMLRSTYAGLVTPVGDTNIYNQPIYPRNFERLVYAICLFFFVKIPGVQREISKMWNCRNLPEEVLPSRKVISFDLNCIMVIPVIFSFCFVLLFSTLIFSYSCFWGMRFLLHVLAGYASGSNVGLFVNILTSL